MLQWYFDHLSSNVTRSQDPVPHVVAGFVPSYQLLLLLSSGLQVRILLIYHIKRFNIFQPGLAHTITFGRTESVEFPFSPRNLTDGGCGINGNFSYFMGIWCRESQGLTWKLFLPRNLPLPTSAPSWVSQYANSVYALRTSNGWNRHFKNNLIFASLKVPMIPLLAPSWRWAPVCCYTRGPLDLQTPPPACPGPEEARWHPRWQNACEKARQGDLKQPTSSGVRPPAHTPVQPCLLTGLPHLPSLFASAPVKVSGADWSSTSLGLGTLSPTKPCPDGGKQTVDLAGLPGQEAICRKSSLGHWEANRC